MQQIGLDEILSVMMSRVDGVAAGMENIKSKFNIMGRVLYRKGLLSDEDVIAAIKEEHKLLFDLGAIKEEPSEEMTLAIADSLLQWLKGDVEAIKSSMIAYEEKMKEAMMKEEESKPKIDVASPSMLRQLDQMSGGNRGGKLII